MSSRDAEIRTTVERFITEIHGLVRQAAVAAVTDALAGTAGPSRPTRPRSATRATPAARPSGKKRPPAEMAKTVEALAAAIKSKPGSRIEEIAKVLSKRTKELALPTKKLLAAKRIRSTGQKRATRYYPR